MGTFYNPKIITDGLLLCLDVANTKSYSGSGTTWTDLSGRNNNGTIVNNPIYSSGATANFSLDGVDEYIYTSGFSNVSIGNWPVSMEIWFNSGTVINNDFVYLGGVRSGSDNYVPLGIGLEARNAWAGNYSSNYGVVAISNYPRYAKSSPGSIIDNTWYQIVQTATSDNTKLYINGVLVDTSSSSQTYYTGITSSWGIGCAGYTGGSVEYSAYTSNQKISVFKIYNIELTAIQILQNYQALRGRFGI